MSEKPSEESVARGLISGDNFSEFLGKVGTDEYSRILTEISSKFDGLQLELKRKMKEIPFLLGYTLRTTEQQAESPSNLHQERKIISTCAAKDCYLVDNVDFQR